MMRLESLRRSALFLDASSSWLSCVRQLTADISRQEGLGSSAAFFATSSSPASESESRAGGSDGSRTRGGAAGSGPSSRSISASASTSALSSPSASRTRSPRTVSSTGAMTAKSGAQAPGMDDLAMQNAPQQVMQLLGDPRSGVADDVSAPSPFGEMAVSMVHHQSSNEVYWYKYELAGGAFKETQRNSRLSEASKNLMYVLRAKDPKRWTTKALASKFRVREQRVIAILALKEMETHRMEAGHMLSGPLSAYACPVDLNHVALDAATGEPLEYSNKKAADAVLARAKESQTGGTGRQDISESSSVLDEFVAGGAAGLGASQASASHAPELTFQSHSFDHTLPAVAVATQQLQLQLLEILEAFDFDISALKTSFMDKFEALHTKITANLPVVAAAREDAAEDAERGSSQGSQLLVTKLGAVKSSLERLFAALEALLSVSDVLKEEASLASSRRALIALWRGHLQAHGEDVRSPAVQLDPAAAQALQSLLEAGSWHGQRLLRLMLGLPLELRQLIISNCPSVAPELNAQGVDLEALLSSTDYQGPGASRTRKAMVASAATDIPAQNEGAQAKGEAIKERVGAVGKTPSLLPIDLFGFRPTAKSETQPGGVDFNSLAQLLGSLSATSSFLRSAAVGLEDGKVAMVGSYGAEAAAGPDVSVLSLMHHFDSLSSADAMLTKFSNSCSSVDEQYGTRRQAQGSMEDYMQRLEQLHEVDPAYPDRVEQYEAVMQLLGRRGGEAAESVKHLVAELEGAGAVDHVIRVVAGQGEVPAEQGMPPFNSMDAHTHVLAERQQLEAYAKIGQRVRSWDLVAAYLDSQVAGKVYHRGAGERHLVRLPSYPAFQGYSLEDFDRMEESELSQLSRLVSESEEARLMDSFSSDLMFNLGLQGERLQDGSKPAPPPNLTSSLDNNPLVVYGITDAGETQYPPLFVSETSGARRALNEQELVFQERRRARKQVAYQMQQIKRKPGFI